MKKIKIVLGILIVVAISFCTIVIIKTKQNTLTNFSFGYDNVPTLYSVVGVRKIDQIKNIVLDIGQQKDIKYEAQAVSTQDVNRYIKKLRTKGYMVVKAFENHSGQLGIKSKDNGQVILIDIDFKENGNTVITYSKVIGNLESKD